jgi:hypothetical protein
MTQPSLSAWCETLQLKLMAALDAVWATLETSDDPVAIRKARDKAKACGELAAVARKVAAMGGLARPKPPAEAILRYMAKHQTSGWTARSGRWPIPPGGASCSA